MPVETLKFRPEIALFPLHTVLFPSGVLPLRIFETRYLDMIGRCLKHDEGFGVVAIREGSEIGEADTYAVGTVAEIVSWHQDERGLLGITAIGRRRFEVEARARRNDGLYVGQVAWRPPESRIPLAERHRPLAEVLRKSPLESPHRDIPDDLDDAAWVAHRLAELLPLDLAVRQRLLETDDVLAKLDALEAILENLLQGKESEGG